MSNPPSPSQFQHELDHCLHPKPDRCKDEAELLAEQEAFFLRREPGSARIMGETRTRTPVLGEVIEREKSTTRKLPTLPIVRPSPKPKVLPEAAPKDTLEEEIDRENRTLLAEMSPDAVEALQHEVLESIPQAFLDHLRNKSHL